MRGKQEKNLLFCRNGVFHQLIVLVPEDQLREKDRFGRCVWDLTFSPDGTQLVVAAGNKVLVYDASDGDLIHSLRGHKDSVFCVAYAKNGKRFASGGGDKQVVIWSHKGEGVLKYSHSDPVICLSYNGVTQQLASGTASDLGLWSPEMRSVSKHKTASKICSLSWTADGMHLAMGLFNGKVSIRDKYGAEKCEVDHCAGTPVWTLAFNPVPAQGDNSIPAGDILVVGGWEQSLGFYRVSGQAVPNMPAVKLDFDPCTIQFFESGEYFLVGGSNKKVSLWSRDGVFLLDVGQEKDDWIWATAARPKGQHIAVGCNDGSLQLQQLLFSTVHGLYKDRYAYRESMSDVVVQHLVTEQRIRIKCRQYVKKIAIYKNKMAVQLPEKVLIYEVSEDQDDAGTDMKYVNTEVIHEKLHCSLLVITKHHIILCQERKLQLFSFKGGMEREWLLEALIRYIKVLGGAPRREGLLVGLKDGTVLKIFVDNPFPIKLIKQSTAIRCLDLSQSRRKLAVVDENASLLVYDVESAELLYQEPNVNSVAWNQEMEHMLAYSGNNSLAIKTGSFPSHTQKMNGFVVGFGGSKIFCLYYVNMQTIYVPQSNSMYRYAEVKDYENAYLVGCLGVTEADWRSLALSAMQDLNFSVARKAFIRIRDVRHIDLLNSIVDKFGPYVKSLSPTQLAYVSGEIAAFQGKFNEAAQLYEAAGRVDLCVEMFTSLQKWEEAKMWAQKQAQTKTARNDLPTGSSSDMEGLSGGRPSSGQGLIEDKRERCVSPSSRDGVSQDVQKIIAEKQAKAVEEDGDLKAAGLFYKNAGELKKAMDLFCSILALDAIIDLVRDERVDPELPRMKVLLQKAAETFKKAGHFPFTKETLLKLGDLRRLVKLYVENEKWQEAMQALRSRPEDTELASLVFLPYAEYLAANSKFEEALDAFDKAFRPDLGLDLLRTLSANAIKQARFKLASTLIWRLGVQTLKTAPKNDIKSVDEALLKFSRYNDQAKLYYAYWICTTFMNEGFTKPHWSSKDVLLCAEFLSNMLKKLLSFESEKSELQGISEIQVLLGAATWAQEHRAYKFGRAISDRLQFLSVPPRKKELQDGQALRLRSLPFSDAEDLAVTCYACLTKNQLHRQSGSNCEQCAQPLIRCMVSFQGLPVVEFQGEDGVLEQDIRRAILLEPIPKMHQEEDLWKESREGNAETLRLGIPESHVMKGNSSEAHEDFLKILHDSVRFKSSSDPSLPRIPLSILSEIPSAEFYVLDQGRTLSSLLPMRFFRSMIPEIRLHLCEVCGSFFEESKWDLEAFVYNDGKCPFCTTDLE